MKRKDQFLEQMNETQDILLRVALETKFDVKDIDNVLKVIAATDNSTVASTILLGRYKEPELLPYCKDCSRKANKTLIRYNPFKCEVIYSYNSITNKQAWFKIGDEPIEENIASSKHYSEDAVKEIGFAVSESEDEYDKLRESYEWKTWKSTVSDKTSSDSMEVNEWIKGQMDEIYEEDDPSVYMYDE